MGFEKYGTNGPLDGSENYESRVPAQELFSYSDRKYSYEEICVSGSFFRDIFCTSANSPPPIVLHQ